MTCASCGHENPGGGSFCMRCGAPLAQTMGDPPSAAGSQLYAQPQPYYGQAQTPAHGAGPVYAGFWIRFLAYVIDSIIMTIGITIIVIPVAIILGIAGAASAASSGDETQLIRLIEGPLVTVSYVIGIGLQWLYEAFMTSSAKRATIGKMAMGLEVTDLAGNRISFGRASGRFFAKILSGVVLWIGYLMQPFTQKKQALHDILAGTLVMKRS